MAGTSIGTAPNGLPSTVVTSFRTFDELSAGSGLAADTVAERLIALAEHSVCRPDLPPG